MGHNVFLESTLEENNEQNNGNMARNVLKKKSMQGLCTRLLAGGKCIISSM